MILYTIPNCHLCEVAKQLIKGLKNTYPELSIETKMIHQNPTLMKLYAWHVPVLKNEKTNQILYWPFTENDLRLFCHLT